MLWAHLMKIFLNSWRCGCRWAAGCCCVQSMLFLIECTSGVRVWMQRWRFAAQSRQSRMYQCRSVSHWITPGCDSFRVHHQSHRRSYCCVGVLLRPALRCWCCQNESHQVQPVDRRVWKYDIRSCRCRRFRPPSHPSAHFHFPSALRPLQLPTESGPYMSMRPQLWNNYDF
jgi:hypothetical protein